MALRLHHSLCTPARARCTVYQVDLFTVREKEAKCLATRLRGQYNSFPVVLQNYSSECVFTRTSLLIVLIALGATGTFFPQFNQAVDYKIKHVIQEHVCVFVIK